MLKIAARRRQRFLLLPVLVALLVALVASPAAADVVVDGCTIVSSPSPTHFTSCPNWNFYGVQLQGYNLAYANLTGSYFEGADLTGAIFYQASVADSTFRAAILHNANFQYADAHSSIGPNQDNFDGTDLTNANFIGANLSGVLIGGNSYVAGSIDGANFTDANLSGAYFCDGPNSRCPTFGSATFEFANLTHARFVGADMSHTTIDAADFTNAILDGANLSNVNECFPFGMPKFTNASLVGATLPGPASVCGGSFATNFAGANLTGSHATGANMNGSNFGGANLTNVVWPSANLLNADLTNANLTNANLTNAILGTATVTGTLLIPPDQHIDTVFDAGGVATWATPSSLPGATPAGCTSVSGTLFPIGITTVTCFVVDAGALQASGTFQVTVTKVNPSASGYVNANGFLSSPGSINVNNPLLAQVGIPSGGAPGAVTISEGTPTLVPPSGYTLAGLEADITAPSQTAAKPLNILFILDPSLLQATGLTIDTVVVLRDGTPIPPCTTPNVAIASPAPSCIYAQGLAFGLPVIGVYSSHASQWNFASYTPPPPPPCNTLSITTSILPNATVGQNYSASVQACSGTAPYKWKKIGTLPQGLKLDPHTGVISGRPGKRDNGTYVFKVQVTDALKGRARHTATASLSIAMN